MDINELYFIGNNTSGQSGTNNPPQTHPHFSIPKSIVFGTFIKQVSCGFHHSALLTIDGLVYTMGSNINGTLGQPIEKMNYSFVPVLVKELTEVSKISSGGFHICAVLESGGMYTWGKGIDGQLGTGVFRNSGMAAKVMALGNDVDDVSCGINHTLVRCGQTCYAFGNGIYGQLGINGNKNLSQPAKVLLDNVQDIAAGDHHSLFLVDGQVYGCGENKLGQTGCTHKKYILKPQPTSLNNISIIKGGKISAALTNNGELYVWGGRFNQPQPHKLTHFQHNIMDIRVGNQTLYCLTSLNELYCLEFSTGDVEKVEWKLVPINTSAVLDFSVGESHAFILGDIVSQLPYQTAVMDTLTNIEGSCARKSMHHSVSSVPISEEECARTPSSIIREPYPFTQHSPEPIPQFQPEQKPSEQMLGKLDKILNMLQKNSKLQQTIQPELTESLPTNRNKQNTLSGSQNKSTQRLLSNKQLIMELREKQLKISELQEKLSRKDMEIHSQRQLIQMLRKFCDK